MAGETDFEKQAAEMAKPPPPKYTAGPRSTAYVVLLFFIFGLSCGVLGIWSYVLQHYGNFRQYVLFCFLCLRVGCIADSSHT
jgi:hypothetical protein